MSAAGLGAGVGFGAAAGGAQGDVVEQGVGQGALGHDELKCHNSPYLLWLFSSLALP